MVPMRPGRHEIRTVQALRGLACMLVVLYHAADAWGARQMPQRSADAVWPNGAAGVDLFFVISGFVMALTSADLGGRTGAWRFVRRRLRRVVPLYWLMTGVKLIILLAVARPAALPSLWHSAASLLFIPSRDAAGVVRPVLGVGWTLQFEMLFYLLFALSLACRRPAWRVLLPTLAPLAVAGFFRGPHWPAPLVLANGLVLEFCLGLGVAAWWQSSPRPRPRRLAACLFGAGLAPLLTLPQPGTLRFAVWGLPAALMLAGAVAAEPWLGKLLPRWLLTVGDASYATYLVHPFVVPVLARGAAHAPAWLTLPALLVASLGVSAAAGLALNRFVDQPIQCWLSAASGFRLRSAEPVAQLVQP